MRFVWDENKNRSNRAKHGVSFEAAMLAFDDPGSLSRPDKFRGSRRAMAVLGVFWEHASRRGVHLQAPPQRGSLPDNFRQKSHKT